jgi:hypothetical protein
MLVVRTVEAHPVSLPNARSINVDPEHGSVVRDGTLSETAVPDLLARAHRMRFTGMLAFYTPGQEPSSIRLAEGTVVRANGPFRSKEVEWEILGRYLPPETLEFASQHAADYGVGPFSAVERLVLLPRETLDSARVGLTILGVRTMCALPGVTRYEFRPLPEVALPGSEPEVAVEPLGLLVECYLVEPHRELAARSIAPFEHAALSVDTENARRTLATLHGPVRAVLESLTLSPSSVQALRERGVVSPDELVASVGALLVTRLVTLRGHAGSQTFPAVRPASGLPPRAGDSQPPVSGFPSRMPTARPESGFVTSEHTGSERGAKEHAMEQKVEEAWMLAEADPTRAEKIGSVVHKAVAVFPRNPRLRYYLARVHVKANRLPEAVKELETVLALDPSDVDAVNELARLKRLLAPSIRPGPNGPASDR